MGLQFTKTIAFIKISTLAAHVAFSIPENIKHSEKGTDKQAKHVGGVGNKTTGKFDTEFKRLTLPKRFNQF